MSSCLHIDRHDASHVSVEYREHTLCACMQVYASNRNDLSGISLRGRLGPVARFLYGLVIYTFISKILIVEMVFDLGHVGRYVGEGQ